MQKDDNYNWCETLEAHMTNEVKQILSSHEGLPITSFDEMALLEAI